MTEKNSPFSKSSYVRYLVPFFIFLVLSGFQGLVKGPAIFWFYGVKIVISLLLFAYFFKGHWREIEGRFDGWAILTGALVLVIWILLCSLSHGKHEIVFNPAQIDSKPEMVLAIVARLAGATLVVPLIEEVVWRSFLMRFLIKEDFLSVPLGSYTFFSFWMTVLIFAVAHPMWQWGAAILTAMIYGFYLVKTKNLWGCILAHAVTNLGLGIYILATGNWNLWV